MKDKEGMFNIQLECMFVGAIAIGKVIREDGIVTENLWPVAEDVNK